MASEYSLIFLKWLYKGWPKCGPPTYFCGPRTFFVIWKSSTYSLFTPIRWKTVHIYSQKASKGPIFFCVIVTNFKKCGPRWKIIFLFGPRLKKSGHPWTILYKKCQVFSTVFTSCKQFIVFSVVVVVVVCQNVQIKFVATQQEFLF